MRLSASIPGNDLAARLQTARELGFSATDLWFNPDTIVPDGTEIREQFARHGVALSQVSCYTNLEAAPGATRERQMARLKEIIEFSALAGAGCVASGCGHMNPDRVDDVFSAHPDNWTPVAMDRLVESCREAALWAEAAGVIFCIESWVILTLNSPQKMRELADRVNSPGFGLLFDPVNLMNLDTYFRNGDVIREAFDLLGDRIKVVHAKDTILIDSAFTFHMSEAPIGKGRLDYETLLRCIAELQDEETPLHIEHLPGIDDIIQARDHIQSLADRIGVTTR